QQLECADFNDPVDLDLLPGCLQVQHDERSLQLDVLQHHLTSIELSDEHFLALKVLDRSWPGIGHRNSGFARPSPLKVTEALVTGGDPRGSDPLGDPVGAASSLPQVW